MRIKRLRIQKICIDVQDKEDKDLRKNCKKQSLRKNNVKNKENHELNMHSFWERQFPTYRSPGGSGWFLVVNKNGYYFR